MPLVRISHATGKPASFSAAVSRSVHDAMVETFNVPADDFFQILTGHEPGLELLAPASFLGIEHTKDVVFVQITCAEGRTLEQKRALYASIARRISEASSIKASDVVINLVETKRENWSFGNGLAPFAPAAS